MQYIKKGKKTVKPNHKKGKQLNQNVVKNLEQKLPQRYSNGQEKHENVFNTTIH